MEYLQNKYVWIAVAVVVAFIAFSGDVGFDWETLLK